MNRLPAALVPLTLAMLAMAGLTYCTASQPTTLEKGAYRPAPPFNPSTRAPHTYKPGQPTSDAQPQPRPPPVPHTPKTRSEPTIWASDVPDDAPETPLIDGFIIPFPEGAETDEDKFLTRECAMLANGTKGVWDPIDLRASWDKLVRKCLAAKLFKACVLVVEDVYRARIGGGEVFRDVRGWLKITKPTAFDLERSMCGGVVMPPASEKMIDDFAGPVETLLKGRIQRIFNVR